MILDLDLVYDTILYDLSLWRIWLTRSLCEYDTTRYPSQI